MAGENADIVRRGLEKWIATLRRPAEFSPGFEWVMSTFEGWPDEDSYKGWDEFERFFAAWLQPYEGDWEARVESVHELEDGRVVAVFRQSARPRGGSTRVELSVGIIYTVQGGLIRRADCYANVESALEAAGLRA